MQHITVGFLSTPIILHSRFNMKLRSVMTSAFGVVALTQFASPASAAILFNETFGGSAPDQYNVIGAVGSNFTVTGGNIDLIGEAGGYDFYPGNGKYIDLNGNTGGTITSSIFNFTPGETGTVTFNYGTNGTGTSAEVFFGGVSLGTVFAPTDGLLATATFNLNSTSGALSFVGNGNTGARGIVLDNIQLSSNPSEVPEPSDFVGTAFAFGSVVLLKRNLSKKRNTSK
jgi:hypothetical protein